MKKSVYTALDLIFPFLYVIKNKYEAKTNI